jgi:hypothetical protein
MTRSTDPAPGSMRTMPPLSNRGERGKLVMIDP